MSSPLALHEGTLSMMTALLSNFLFAEWIQDRTTRIIVYSAIGFFVGGFIFRMLFMIIANQRSRPMGIFDEELFQPDPGRIVTVPKGKLFRKVKPTKILLEFMATKDKWFNPEYLREVAKETFKNIRDAWEESDFELLRGYVTPAFYDRYEESMEEKDELLRPKPLSNMKLLRIDLVHFNASAKPENHTFTALISAEDLEFEEDDDDDDRRRDRKGPRIDYQEFWTFKRRSRWQLDRIRTVEISDAVLEQNALQTDWFKEFRDHYNDEPDNMDFVIPV
jgi:hypothetical protein